MLGESPNADVDERIEADYHAMKAWLPEVATDILDIGCGFPRIDVWLARHYGGGVNLHLMDGDKDNRHLKGAGFHQYATKPYKSRHIAAKYLRKELPDCGVYDYPPDQRLTIPCDLIISRRAWGHHFPVATYLPLAERSLRPGGRIILDIRVHRETANALTARGFKILADDLEVRSYKSKRLVLSR